MKRVQRVFLVLVLVVAIGGLATACGVATENSAKAAEEEYAARGYGGEVSAKAQQVKAPGANDEPSTHEMMAMFILSQSGLDSDLSTYKRVDLVTMTKDDGTEFKAVVIDENDTYFSEAAASGE